MKTSTFRLLAAVLALFTHGSSTRAADIVNNWSFLEPGVVPKVSNFASLGIPICFSGFRAGGAVDATSTPANPFPGTERALYMEPAPDTGLVRIRTRPFLAENPAHGAFEMTFRLLEGSFYMIAGTIPLPWDPKIEASYLAPESLLSLNFKTGAPVLGEKRLALVTEEITAITAEENYTLRIEWEPVDKTVVFRFSLNGKPLLNPGGEPFSTAAERSQFDQGSLGFLISSGQKETPCAKVFIGSISAEALTP